MSGYPVADFEALLVRLLSANNEERKAAEATLETLKGDPNNLVVSLVTAFRNQALPVPSRQMACSVLRPMLIKSEGSVWPALTAQSRTFIQRELFAAIETEKAPPVIRKVIACIADLGAFLSNKVRHAATPIFSLWRQI